MQKLTFIHLGRKLILTFAVLFSLYLFPQSDSKNTEKSVSEKEKLLNELNELEERKDSINQRISELEKKSEPKKDKEQKNEEDFFKLEDTIVTTASKREQKVTDAPLSLSNQSRLLKAKKTESFLIV